VTAADLPYFAVGVLAIIGGAALVALAFLACFVGWRDR
jgi:hypothetical protein